MFRKLCSFPQEVDKTHVSRHEEFESVYQESIIQKAITNLKESLEIGNNFFPRIFSQRWKNFFNVNLSQFFPPETFFYIEFVPTILIFSRNSKNK